MTTHHRRTPSRLTAGVAVACTLVLGAGVAALAATGPRGTYLELVPSRPPDTVEVLAPGATGRWWVEVTLRDAPRPTSLAVTVDASGDEPALLDVLRLTATFCDRPAREQGSCAGSVRPLVTDAPLRDLASAGGGRRTEVGVSTSGLLLVDVRLDPHPPRAAQSAVAGVGVRVDAAGGDGATGRATHPRTGVATRTTAAVAGAMLGVGLAAAVAARRRRVAARPGGVS